MQSNSPRNTGIVAVIASLAAAIVIASTSAQDRTPDPGAWGSDHVNKPLPMYTTGEECLFCHREKVGNTLSTEAHAQTMRVVQAVSPTLRALLASEDAASFAGETTYVLGGSQVRRFLKPNGAYGQFALHAAKWTPGEEGEAGMLTGADGAWDNDRFAQRCAGCHATAVETEYHAVSAASLDCFVCHGDTPQGHQNKPERALFAAKREREPLVEISICAQCHLRGGSSRSSGLPYPNQFVPGDNLFRDFEVDLSSETIAAMNAGDRHIFENVRAVLFGGVLDLTCTSCHDIHDQSSRKHRILKRLQRDAYCRICHDNLEDYSSLVGYDVHSDLCEY